MSALRCHWASVPPVRLAGLPSRAENAPSGSNCTLQPSGSVLSLAAVLAAFSALSQAVKGIDLSVAYALWGGFGIAATLAAGWVLFGQRLNNKGWIGVILLLAGMIMIKLA